MAQLISHISPLSPPPCLWSFWANEGCVPFRLAFAAFVKLACNQSLIGGGGDIRPETYKYIWQHWLLKLAISVIT